MTGQTPTISDTKKRPEYDPTVMYGVEVDERDTRIPSEQTWGAEERKKLNATYHISSKTKRKQLAHLESFITTLAEMSTEKARWQRIIEHANSLADELEMPHEQFYSTALIEYIGKLENEKFTRELDESYKDADQNEDVAVLNYLIDHYDPRFADE